MAKEKNTLADDSLLFKAGITRSSKNGSPIKDVSLSDLDNSALVLTGTFRFDAPGSPLKSTQQLNVDFSKFHNHTFFNSAEAKTQLAFSKIINQMPFDDSKSEIITFVDKLSGFEKHVYDNFPVHVGYLSFSGSNSATEPGSYITVNDFKGSTQPTLTKSPTGESVLDPDTKPFTVEFHFSVPTTANDNQVILQKLSGSNGVTLFLSQSTSTATADLFCLISSSSLNLSASLEVTKGEFQHIAAVFDRSAGPGQIKMYNNAVQKASSSFGHLGKIDFKTSPAYIGSGSVHSQNSYIFTPVETLSGAIDDFRFWHKAKTQTEIKTQRFNEIFADPKLKLFFRFNEPSGSYDGSGESLVLDSSGNALHSTISNFSMSLRNTSSFGTSPVLGESRMSTICLFPSFGDITNLSSRLLLSASLYDSNNPNLVTKLIPPHYLTDASAAEGFSQENGNLSDTVATNIDQPGGAVIGQPQIIAGMLFTFAKTFDELKMFVDEFKRLLKVDHLSNETVSNQMLPWLSRYYGIKLPSLFDSANIVQFFEGQDVRLDRAQTTSLQTIQNTIWRRIFSELPFLFSTRGTHQSIRATLASMGISSNGPIRIREFGGSKLRTLGDSYIRRNEIAAMLDMSGTFGSQGTLNFHGIDGSRPFLQGSFLSGSRTEPGLPRVWGNGGTGLVHPVTGTDKSSDGLFTSGSWTWEGRYKFDAKFIHPQYQSLARMHVTGTTAPSNKHGTLFNCVAKKPEPASSVTGSITLYGHPTTSTAAPTLQLILTGVDIFDGGKWYVSFGRERNDLFESYVSSSYFLRAAKFSPAGMEQYYTTSSLYDDSITPNSLQRRSVAYNASGSFMVIGSQSLDTSGGKFLNNTSIESNSRTTTFTGKVANLRFWSKSLSEQETKTHVRNYKSLGVTDPEVNFNFVTNMSGSFQCLRQDISLDQPTTESNVSGRLTAFDFSQNYLTFAGTGFEVSKRIIKPERYDFEVLSSNFQSGENPNKIRIRSYKQQNNIDTHDAATAPLYEIPQNDQPNDDKRVAIEISTTQGLNEDIMNIFATLDKLDNVIGSPELVFSQNYPHMRNLRRIYFNRLTDKVNLQSFFEFFKFFDDTIGDILEQMLPHDAKFSGTSYVIESHALERAKFSYKYYDLYLGEEDRGGKEVILLQQLVGTVRKF